MKRAIFPLFIFFILITGIFYYYPKLHFVKEVDHAFLHDRPLACQTCGALMWNGIQAHSCTDVLEEIN
ncbi:MAG: hypothetical protein H7A41_03400 [Chlamydiales bacterium]|nr:hypothetical protein [Chlamydiia bacterium]MCP5504181.1 hypothetical protein [Chlamydiales bacterium]